MPRRRCCLVSSMRDAHPIREQAQGLPALIPVCDAAPARDLGSMSIRLSRQSHGLPVYLSVQSPASLMRGGCDGTG